MREPLSISVGSGTRHAVCCRALRCGKDWTVAVTGGEGPHVGAVTLAAFDGIAGRVCRESRVLPGHRDDAVSERWAAALAGALRCRVCVSAGLHLDDASREDIEALLKNSEKCLSQLLAELAEEI